MITQEELKKELIYDEGKGRFTRLITRGKIKAGKLAGGLNKGGYERISVLGTSYYTHRLVWLYVYGYFPSELDHVNGNKSDNRLCNLRECSRSENNSNVSYRGSFSGFKGVSFNPLNKRWRAKAYLNGKPIHVGYFDTPEEAHVAYAKKAYELYGEFVRLK